MTSRLPALAGLLRRLPHRLRIALTTKPLAYWSLTALVAAVVGYGVYGVVASAEATRTGYGTTAPALVVTQAVAAGSTLDGSNTERRDLPRALMPEGTITELPVGAVASTALAAGETLHRLRVGRGGDGPVAALLPDGTRGLAVALDETGLPLRPGDRVDVIAAVTAGLGGEGRVVANAATIAHVGERSAVVAVPVAQATATAQAIVDGGVVLALSAGP